MRNVLDKVPDSAREEVKAHLQTVRHAAGEQAAVTVLERFEHKYPSAMRSFRTDIIRDFKFLSIAWTNLKTTRFLRNDYLNMHVLLIDL